MANLSLFMKLGGESAILQLLDAFHMKLLGDREVRPWFQGVDMDSLMRKQSAMLTYLFGGSGAYDGKDMVSAHVNLVTHPKFNIGVFDRVCGHLVDAMYEVGVGRHLVEHATVLLLATRGVFDPVRCTRIPAIKQQLQRSASKGHQALVAPAGSLATPGSAGSGARGVVSAGSVPGQQDRGVPSSGPSLMVQPSSSLGKTLSHELFIDDKTRNDILEASAVPDWVAAVEYAKESVGYPCSSSTTSLSDVSVNSAQHGDAVEKLARESRGSRTSLMGQIGGKDGVIKVVDLMYERMLKDAELAPFFEGVDMVTLVRKQRAFISFALGDAKTSMYTGGDIVLAHARLIREKGLKLRHYDRTVAVFLSCLVDAGVPRPLQHKAVTVLLAMRPVFDPARYQEATSVDRLGKLAQVPDWAKSEADKPGASCPYHPPPSSGLVGRTSSTGPGTGFPKSVGMEAPLPSGPHGEEQSSVGAQPLYAGSRLPHPAVSGQAGGGPPGQCCHECAVM